MLIISCKACFFSFLLFLVEKAVCSLVCSFVLICFVLFRLFWFVCLFVYIASKVCIFFVFAFFCFQTSSAIFLCSGRVFMIQGAGEVVLCRCCFVFVRRCKGEEDKRKWKRRLSYPSGPPKTKYNTVYNCFLGLCFTIKQHLLLRCCFIFATRSPEGNVFFLMQNIGESEQPSSPSHLFIFEQRKRCIFHMEQLFTKMSLI